MFFLFDSKFGLLASQSVRQRFGWHVIDSVIVSQGVSQISLSDNHDQSISLSVSHSVSLADKCLVPRSFIHLSIFSFIRLDSQSACTSISQPVSLSISQKVSLPVCL